MINYCIDKDLSRWERIVSTLALKEIAQNKQNDNGCGKDHNERVYAFSHDLLHINNVPN